MIEETEKRLLARAERALVGLLPRGRHAWTALGDRHTDARLLLRADDGRTTMLYVELKPGQLPSSEAVVAQLLARARSVGAAPLLVASYLGPQLRRACEERDVNYLDLTGWVWIHTPSPGFVVRTVGADRDPRPARPATIRRLSGAGAGRTIRALLGTTEPQGVRALASRAGVTPGTVSKVLKTLVAESIVERDPAGAVRVMSKRALVERWTHDYQFLRTNLVAWHLAARGVDHVLDRARASGQPVTGTGSLALRQHLPVRRMPVTGLSQLSLYVADLVDAREQLGLVPTERVTANVILAEPYDSQLLTVGDDRKQIPVVDAGQTVADLLTLPGRGPAEADQLMKVLAEADPAWR